jgi:DNA-binding transcriptional LysR family regulator
MLDSRQLRYFVAVAEELHFGRAADQIRVAQSALSQHVKRLEEDLGVKLLNRSKKSAVTLTDAGSLFLIEARAAILQMERADRIGRMAGRGEAGQLDVAYITSASMSGLLPDVLRRFRDTHEHVEIRLATMETPRQLTAIADGRLDIGFIRPRPRYPDNVDARIVHCEPLFVAMAAGHRLAGQQMVEARELVGEKFIVPEFHEAAGFAGSLVTLSSLADGTIEPHQRVNDFVTAVSLSAAGYGVALVPASMRNLGIPGVVLQQICGFKEQAELAIAWRRSGPSPAIKAFVASLPPALPATEGRSS